VSYKTLRQRGYQSQLNIVNASRGTEMEHIVSFLTFNLADNSDLEGIIHGRCYGHRSFSCGS
jgi:hypothetical protein